MPMNLDMQLVLKGDSSATNFTALLLELIFKADRRNFALLRLGFPNAVEMVECYQQTGEILDLEYD